jgi:hypothetical protein
VCSKRIWLDVVDSQAGGVAEGEGGLVYKAKTLRLDNTLHHHVDNTDRGPGMAREAG